MSLAQHNEDQSAGPMLQRHDAPLKGGCNTRAPPSGAVTSASEAVRGHGKMRFGNILDGFVSRLVQTPPALPVDARKPAAVLVPIVARAEPGVLLTRRTDSLPLHASQICFPGGRFDEADESLVATALRETEEEIGVARSEVGIAGFLEPYRTTTEYTVLPVVGLLPEGVALRPNGDEVAEVFEVPLRYLIDPGNRELRSIERNGVVKRFHVITYGPHVIWGATAGMIVLLSERLWER